MIHAYLFLTNNNRDRDGHGPVFQSHMKRINQKAGTNITVSRYFIDDIFVTYFFIISKINAIFWL